MMSFMIKSNFGSLEEVVHLSPVSKIAADELMEMTIAIIHKVQRKGFIVTIVITDNNRVNQRFFVLLAGQLNYLKNPMFPQLKIFLMFDPIHIIKSFRNNWINRPGSISFYN